MNLQELFERAIEVLFQQRYSINKELLISKTWLAVETNDGVTYDVRSLEKLTSDLICFEVLSNDKNYQVVTIPAVSIRLVAWRHIEGKPKGTMIARTALPSSWPWHEYIPR